MPLRPRRAALPRVLALLLPLVPTLGPAETGLVSGPVEVRDGDTIVVAGVPVRLSGLHCPERGEPGGARATAAMRALTAGSGVACRLNGRRSYDRRIGRCATERGDLAAVLIARGVCARCPRYDPEARYAAAQRRAGPWRGPTPRYCAPRG